MSKIIRTPSKVLGGITPEEKKRLDAHAQKWIANALRTDPVEYFSNRIFRTIKYICP